MPDPDWWAEERDSAYHRARGAGLFLAALTVTAAPIAVGVVIYVIFRLGVTP